MAHVKFVVFTSSRTGSTWLIDLLNLQSGVEAHGELFLRHSRSSPAIAGRDDLPRFIDEHGVPKLTRVPRVFSYLNELFRRKSTVGFKLMYTQLREHPEILAYLILHRVRVVHLQRSNYIDVLISEELARATGASHERAGVKGEIPRVYLDPGTLVGRIRQRERALRIARRLVGWSGCPSLMTTYEDLQCDVREFNRVCRFLDVANPNAQLMPNIQKRVNRAHRDSIANYEEIDLLLRSTSYAHLLN